jgi:hypothetical protein
MLCLAQRQVGKPNPTVPSIQHEWGPSWQYMSHAVEKKERPKEKHADVANEKKGSDLFPCWCQFFEQKSTLFIGNMEQKRRGEQKKKKPFSSAFCCRTAFFFSNNSLEIRRPTCVG